MADPLKAAGPTACTPEHKPPTAYLESQAQQRETLSG